MADEHYITSQVRRAIPSSSSVGIMRTVTRESGVEMMGSIGFFVQLDPDGAQLVADTAAALIGVLLALRQYRILQKTLAVK